MESLETIIILMFASVILVGVAQRFHIPYPIALILGGTAIGFIPILPTVNFDPNLILVIVLPPILYYASFGISLREFKRNWREIFSLALGLVVVTTLVIGILFKWIFPEYPWALAFAFGAIVSPPDAVSATSILKRFSIGPRLMTLLEGESLINDASALILYRLAVTALLTGVFSFSEGSIEFLKITSGGVVVGLILGVIMQLFSRRYLEPIVGVIFSFTIPYVTYIVADSLNVSGVLAVVVNGLFGSRILKTHYSSLRRILGFAAWDIFIILLNCFVFILIGLQLRTLTTNMTFDKMVTYTGFAFLIFLAMIMVRMVWVYSKSAIDYIKALKDPNASSLCPEIVREAALIGWSGMRGIVSLVAALALPLTLSDGMPLEGRNEVIFITFVVILLTLLIPGFTLPSLIRWLNIHPQSELHGLRRIRKQLAHAAEEKIHVLHDLGTINHEEFDFLMAYFHLQRKVIEISISSQKKLQPLESARLDVIKTKRKKLLELWEQDEIDDKLLNQLEHEIDLEETHTARAEIR